MQVSMQNKYPVFKLQARITASKEIDRLCAWILWERHLAAIIRLEATSTRRAPMIWGAELNSMKTRIAMVIVITLLFSASLALAGPGGRGMGAAVMGGDRATA